jgi:plasmid stabilization system protein ParE
LNNRHVRFTATAQEHVRREKAWWLANRDHPDVFTEELEQALQIIAALPGAGTLYPQSPVPGVRRVYLRRLAVHLYYTFDDAGVIVRALWGARRERGPRISQTSPCTAPSPKGDCIRHRRRFLPGTDCAQNPVEHCVQFLAQVLGKIAQHEITTLL